MDRTIGERIWGLMLTRGILLLLLGIFILAWPGITLAIAVMLFALYLVIVGVVSIIHGILSIFEGWYGIAAVVLGLLATILGIYIFKNPAASLVTYVILLGIWLIIKGIIDIFSPEYKRGESKAWSILIGALTIIAGILLLNQPIINGIALYWVVSLYAFIAGAIKIATAISFKSLTK